MWGSKMGSIEFCLRTCAYLLACAAIAGAQSAPTLILVNGKIWTGNPKQVVAQAVAITGERITGVGTTEEIEHLKTASTGRIDLEGRLAIPAFNDAHVHLLAGGINLAGPQLRFSKSQEDFRNTLSIYAQKQPKGRWITGGNWDHENWSPPVLPTRDLIDDVTAGRPVFIKRLDGHMALANSLALQLAGVDKNTKDVPGGVIVRDGQGNPTGILKDAAMQLVGRAIPSPRQDEMIAAIKAAQVYANAQGVTSVQDMSTSPDLLRAYQTMCNTGELHLRVSTHAPLPEWKRLANAGVQARFGNEQIQVGALKGYADGSLGSTTALLAAPYLDAPGNSGIPSAELSDPLKMWSNIRDADKAGLQIAIHAIGDKANDSILNMYNRLAAENGARDRRLRIEHAQHILPADVVRFGQQHVIASMQPRHLADDGRWAEKRIGPERAKTAYAFRSLLDSGAVLAFGSDWDVAPMSPIWGIAAAVTRRTLDEKHPDGWIPEQKITVAEAVRAYTYGAAYASFEEGVKGTIEPGKLADIAVLSQDIFTIDPAKIEDTKVIDTIFNGKIILTDEHAHYRKLPSGLLLRP